MRLDTEEQISQRDQQHQDSEQDKGREHCRGRRLRGDDVATAGKQGQYQRADDLADTVGGLTPDEREPSRTPYCSTV
jgi:hypothetical protein